MSLEFALDGIGERSPRRLVSAQIQAGLDELYFAYERLAGVVV